MIRSHMSLAQIAAAARKEVGQVLRYVAEQHAELVHNCPRPDSDQLLRRSGHFTSGKHLQWIYVATAFKGRATIYPLLWYPTSKGNCAMQIDAEGPASYFQEHVLDQYIVRYLRGGDLFNALREFQLHNYDKVFLPDTYKGDDTSYVANIDDGYVAGEYRRSDALVYFRTYYDQKMGERRFGHTRPSLKWRAALHNAQFEHVGRRDTPHAAWGRGYALLPEHVELAA